MVGNASGFDDGSANAVNSCSIPDMSAEVSTAAAGGTADIFGASPGDDHYYPVGPGNYIKATYPNAIKHAAEIYLQVPATASQAAHEIQANTSVGFQYTPANGIATTPTNANYGTIVQQLQSQGTQYVSEYSDDNSAERLLQAMQQANYAPQVVDWISEEYSPQFAQQTVARVQRRPRGDDGDRGLRGRRSNPGLQLMEQWMDRVAGAGNWHKDIFAMLAWSAGLAFEQAAKEVGPALTRPALISKIQGITNWTGGGVTPPSDIGDQGALEVLLLREDLRTAASSASTRPHRTRTTATAATSSTDPHGQPRDGALSSDARISRVHGHRPGAGARPTPSRPAAWS